MTDIYLTVSLPTHNGDDTPQNYGSLYFRCVLFPTFLELPILDGDVKRSQSLTASVITVLTAAALGFSLKLHFQPMIHVKYTTNEHHLYRTSIL